MAATVRIAALGAAGLISLLTKQPQTSQSGAVVSPPTPPATPSIQTAATPIQAETSPSTTEHSAASSTVDTSTWKTYTDADYHFTFRYPQQLFIRITGPVVYAIKRISLSDELATRSINFYVTTTSSIKRWNEYVASEDTHNCGRVCDEPYSYLVCEATSTSCTEDSYEGSFSTTLERRGVIAEGDLRVE